MSDTASLNPGDDPDRKKTRAMRLTETDIPLEETRMSGPEEPVEIVPGYVLIDKLGEGGMGVVYKALQKSLNRVIALKMMRSYDDESFVARFRREAIAGAKINHPNIVAVYDHGTAHGAVYLVMEFVEGRNCADLVRTQGRVAVNTAFQIVKGSVLGLGHAFEQGVIHRDIKPANLMLDESGSSDPFGVAQVAVKIGDFGLARLRDGGAESPDLTQTGSVMGTPGYMAPEQSLGREVDFRADIYSLGVTAYYLITGKRPFAGQTAMDIFHQKMSGSAVNPRDYVPELPEGTVRVIARMMARDPNDRYSSYAELLKDVDHLIAEREPDTGEVPPASQSIAEPSEPSGVSKRRQQKSSGSGSSRVVRGVLLGVVLLAIGVSAAILATEKKDDPKDGSGTREEPSKAAAWMDEGDDDFLRNVSRHLTAAAGVQEERALITKRAARVLGVRELEAVDRLETLHGKAEYGALTTAARATCSPYEDCSLPIPPRIRELRALGEAAMRGGAGREERRVFKQAVASDDPRRIVELLEGFGESFPFSPVVADAQARYESAQRDVMVEDARNLVQRAETSWAQGRYLEIAAAVTKCEEHCRRCGIEEPEGLARFRRIVEQAVASGLGADERDVWRRVNASRDDAELVAELLAGFSERFPFSPVLKDADILFREAAAKTTLLEISVLPRRAGISLDGDRVGTGTFSKRLLRGEHSVVVTADGFHTLRRTVRLEGEAQELSWRLGPRPAASLQKNPRRNRSLLGPFSAWVGRGFAYDDYQAALTGQSASGKWQVIRRPLGPILTKSPFEGTRGWVVAILVQLKSGEAEIRLLDGPQGERAVFGLRDGKVYVGERTKDGLTVWTEKAFAVNRVSRFEIAWHGDVLEVTAEGKDYLGSMKPSWTPLAVGETAIELGAKGEPGETQFSEPFIHPMN